jgi:two-component system NtrC family sensor kinase
MSAPLGVRTARRMRWKGCQLPLWARFALGASVLVALGAVGAALAGACLGFSTALVPVLLALVGTGVLAALGFSFLATRSLSRSLTRLATAADAVARGHLDQSNEVATDDETRPLAASFTAMVDRLREKTRSLEEEERSRGDELMQLQSRIVHSEKLASMGRLAAGVAHELNTPLGGILSLAMLALEGCGEGHPLRGDLEIIVKQALRCRDIVKGLLDFAHQSEGRAVATQVNPVIENTLALLERQAIFQNVRTVRRLRADCPLVLIDPSQLQSVVMNLVINAVDAMQENGLLTVETACDEVGQQVLLLVSDTGKGIPDKIKPLIFEPFFTTKTAGVGTGLGLAVVYGIVKRAGGRISVESAPGSTTFTVRLPILQQGGGDARGAPAGDA